MHVRVWLKFKLMIYQLYMCLREGMIDRKFRGKVTNLPTINSLFFLYGFSNYLISQHIPAKFPHTEVEQWWHNHFNKNDIMIVADIAMDYCSKQTTYGIIQQRVLQVIML